MNLFVNELITRWDENAFGAVGRMLPDWQPVFPKKDECRIGASCGCVESHIEMNWLSLTGIALTSD
jgi:hypothetical protein